MLRLVSRATEPTNPATEVVRWMRSERIGALFFEGAWRWRDSFEKDIALAERFLEIGKARSPGGFTGECLRR